VSGIHFKGESKTTQFESFAPKSVAISGCPIQPEVLVNTLYALKEEYVLRLDEYFRPKEYFAYTIHNGCTRNEYFEYKIDNHSFGTLEGCMFYEHGCRGPFTKGSCNKILWNEVNSKTRAGVPCFGCMEPTFPKENLFVTKKNMGIPENLPLGIPKRAYLAIAGVTKAFKIEKFEKKLLDD
jgi:hydrogenase small subunit